MSTTKKQSKNTDENAKARKLQINKETLKDLSPKEGEQVKAGGRPTQCTRDESGMLNLVNINNIKQQQSEHRRKTHD